MIPRRPLHRPSNRSLQGFGTGPAIASAEGGFSSAGYIGVVATRGRVPTSSFGAGTSTTLMSRSMHFAREALSSIKILVPNFLVDVSGATLNEIGLGFAATVTASIEYPAATFTQVKFAGSTSGSVPDIGTLLSDAIIVSIPKDAQFWVRMYMVNAGGFLIDGTGQEGSVTNGDLCNDFDGDITMSGTVSNQFAGYTFAPLAILGLTRRPSVLGIGPSTLAGNQDTQDVSGDIGTLMRSVGPKYGYINAGVASDTFGHFVSSHTNRAALGQYVTHIFYEMKNDSLGGGTGPVIANLQTMCGYNPGKIHMALTTSPFTTGAWTLVNQTDQTVGVNYTGWNTALLAKPAPITAVFDQNAVDATGTRGLQYWNADGTPAKWTTDGIHDTQFSALALQTALQASIQAAIG